MFGRVAILAWVLSLTLLGCKEDAPPPAPQPEAKEEPAPSPEQTAALARAKEEAKRLDAEREKKKARERRETCCLALAKKGFELRSTDYIAGKEVCEAARDEQKTLEDVRSDIAEAIGDQELPAECLPKGAGAGDAAKLDGTADGDTADSD